MYSEEGFHRFKLVSLPYLENEIKGEITTTNIEQMLQEVAEAVGKPIQLEGYAIAIPQKLRGTGYFDNNTDFVTEDAELVIDSERHGKELRGVVKVFNGLKSS